MKLTNSASSHKTNAQNIRKKKKCPNKVKKKQTYRGAKIKEKQNQASQDPRQKFKNLLVGVG